MTIDLFEIIKCKTFNANLIIILKTNKNVSIWESYIPKLYVLMDSCSTGRQETKEEQWESEACLGYIHSENIYVELQTQIKHKRGFTILGDIQSIAWLLF